MPGGRPTKYKPEFCEVVLACGEEGNSVAQMAEACDVHRNSMDVWAQEHPQFLEALTRAKQKAQAKLEQMGFEGLEKNGFNGNLWQKTMQARFREEYTETRRQEHVGLSELYEQITQGGSRIRDEIEED